MIVSPHHASLTRSLSAPRRLGLSTIPLTLTATIDSSITFVHCEQHRPIHGLRHQADQRKAGGLYSSADESVQYIRELGFIVNDL